MPILFQRLLGFTCVVGAFHCSFGIRRFGKDSAVGLQIFSSAVQRLNASGHSRVPGHTAKTNKLLGALQETHGRPAEGLLEFGTGRNGGIHFHCWMPEWVSTQYGQACALDQWDPIARVQYCESLASAILRNVRDPNGLPALLYYVEDPCDRAMARVWCDKLAEVGGRPCRGVEANTDDWPVVAGSSSGITPMLPSYAHFYKENKKLRARAKYTIPVALGVPVDVVQAYVDDMQHDPTGESVKPRINDVADLSSVGNVDAAAKVVWDALKKSKGGVDMLWPQPGLGALVMTAYNRPAMPVTRILEAGSS